MLFKRFIWSSGSPPFWWSRIIYAILKEGIMGNIHVKLYGIWTSGQREMLFKDISYQELWQPLWSADQKHLCNYGRRYHETWFCEIILKLDQWFRRYCCLKVFHILSSGSPFVWWSVTICAILVKGIMRKKFCEIILNLGQWFRWRCRLKEFLSVNLATLLFSGAMPFMQFWKRASWEAFMWSYMKFGPVVQ